MKVKSNICWIAFMVVVLAGMLAPCSILAQPEKTDLSLNITYDGYRNLKAGEDRTMFLEVGNWGTRELTGIRLSATAPEGWTVAISPDFIDRLSSGSYQTVDIRLKVADDAAEGDYNIAIIGEADQTRRVTSIYLRVESSSLFWVWVGIGVAAILIAGFVYIFMRFGREEK